MKRISRTCAITALVLAVAGCTSIEMPPNPPALIPARNDGSEASELVAVIVGSRFYPKGGWVIYVDGTPRAWLPARSVFTRIPVTPGTHEVTAGFRYYRVEIILLVPVPGTREVKAGKSVDCAEGRRCALRAELRNPSGYLGVHVEILKESHLGEELDMYRDEVTPNEHLQPKGTIGEKPN